MSLFGAYVRHVRNEKGLTLRAVAELAKADPSTLSRLERGEVATPSEELLVNIAAALDRPLSEVYLAAGRITPQLSSRLEQALPLGLSQTARILQKLEEEIQDTLLPIGTLPLVQEMKPEDMKALALLSEIFNHASEIVDGISTGKVTHTQFEHVVENIRQLKLALLDIGRPTETP